MREPTGAALNGLAAFDYATAFSRNIGWLTEAEQERLRHKRVAIAGVGGVGGFHLTTLARLGVGRFTIADPDRFELANFNRQAGAVMSTLDRPKVDVLAEMARDINPECTIDVFSDGVTPQNLERFFEGVDLYVDGLDAFAFAPREMVFAHCAARGIPATTVAPLGMSAALMNFLPWRNDVRTVLPVVRPVGRREGHPLPGWLCALASASSLSDGPTRVNLV